MSKKTLTRLVAVGAGLGVVVTIFRREFGRAAEAFVFPGATDRKAEEAFDREMIVDKLNRRLGDLIPGFTGVDADLSVFDDDQPHTIGEVKQEAAFIELLRVNGWPFTDDTVLDADDDDNFKVVIDTEVGKVTLVETELGFRVAEFVASDGKVHTDLEFKHDILGDGIDYTTFAAFMTMPDPDEVRAHEEPVDVA